MFHVNNFTINPVCLCRQLRTDLHSVTNFWFHIISIINFFKHKDTTFFINKMQFR